MKEINMMMLGALLFGAIVGASIHVFISTSWAGFWISVWIGTVISGWLTAMTLSTNGKW